MSKFWNFRALDAIGETDEEVPAGGDGTLDIEGEIVAEAGWFGSDGLCVARNFRAELANYRNVTVRINSPGGDVMAGAEIYSALREHSLNGQGRVVAVVTALAASAASVIAMAADEVKMYPTAYMMIHNPWSVAAGDAKEMRKTARTLDVIAEGIINAYQIRTGKSRDELKRMLEAETWMSAATCVEEGFADSVIGMTAAAALCIPGVRMSAKAHGAAEILARMRNEEPEEPDEDPEQEAERSENPEENPEEDPDHAGDPREGDPEKPNDYRREIVKRAQILSRAAQLAGW